MNVVRIGFSILNGRVPPTKAFWYTIMEENEEESDF